jgi:hypothetical protein
MKLNKGLILCAVSAAVGGIIFYLFNKKKPFVFELHPEDIKVEEVDGIVKMTDVIYWFKSLSLASHKDTPFIAEGSKIKELLGFSLDEGTLFMGVYNESPETITHYKVVKGKAFDKRLTDVLSKSVEDNPIIVLN